MHSDYRQQRYITIYRYKPQLRNFADLINKLKSTRLSRARWLDWDGQIYEIRRVGEIKKNVQGKLDKRPPVRDFPTLHDFDCLGR